MQCQMAQESSELHKVQGAIRRQNNCWEDSFLHFSLSSFLEPSVKIIPSHFKKYGPRLWQPWKALFWTLAPLTFDYSIHPDQSWRFHLANFRSLLHSSVRTPRSTPGRVVGKKKSYSCPIVIQGLGQISDEYGLQGHDHTSQLPVSTGLKDTCRLLLCNVQHYLNLSAGQNVGIYWKLMWALHHKWVNINTVMQKKRKENAL